ncbi:sugar efflux transporter for intercellular exchange domain-containing protein [Ditylenchus destructor]|nr:sugar efflux transporter for intercellular exchange domain-containing protein [Ditylenchus destructor]
MIEEPLSVLHVLSFTAIITTISLFFCGIPICLEIWRRKSTEEITGFPFIMGFLGGTFWLRYGLLKLDITMITVNVVGVALMFLYLMFYLYYTKSKAFILFELIVVFGIICTMLVLVEIYGMAIINPLGFVSMTFNIVNFGAPLAGVTVVFKKKTCETLPLPLCTANLLVSSQWCLYGILVHDVYIMTPNGAGILLALLQISLFLVFPRNPGGRAPLGRCCRCLNDLERAEKPDIPSDASHIRNGGCWSRQRVMDRNAIPQSRSACIDFLRSNAFNAGGYYDYGGGIDGSMMSRSSRTTGVDSTAETLTTNVNLSRVSSMSHPDMLWGAAAADAADPYYYYPPSNFMNSSIAAIGSAVASTSQGQPLLRPNPRPYEFDRIREIDDFDRQWNEQELKRTHSAPDLAAE